MELPPLIPRKVFFGNPDKASVKVSPDGSHISYLAPLDGVLNVWVAPRDNAGAARPITHDTHRGILMYFWAYTRDCILYLQDKDGDENYHLYRADVRTGQTEDLTPLDGVQVQVQAVSHKFPQEVIVGINCRDPQWHDLYRLNIVTGERTLLMQNDQFVEMLVDKDYRPRIGLSFVPGGGMDVFAPDSAGCWQKHDAIGPEDSLTTSFMGFDNTGQVAFLADCRGRNTAALLSLNTATGQKTLLAEDAKSDVSDVLFHPTSKHPQAVAFVYQRKRWQVLDQTIADDMAFLQGLCDGEFQITSRTLDDAYWIVAHMVDDGPVRYHLYDRRHQKAEFLFTNRKSLEGLPLAKMHSVVIKSRDGLDLVAYYTLPLGSDSNGDGIPDRPLPMVFSPHGGPAGRDVWGYNPWDQWLANRGYAALCVNFRASTGFGKDFFNAGNLEWGGKIHDDQIDAVQWAVATGIADSARVAVFGGSFGGYSVLAGLTFTPEVFACGVNLAGLSDLTTVVDTAQPYDKPSMDLFFARVGDPRTPEGLAQLKRRSPLYFVDRICKPLLVGQGDNDPRVKRYQADKIVQAMQSKGIPVTYVLYPDEGHTLNRPENRLSFNAIAEAFLARCLGGRCEPVGDDFENSSVQVLVGAENVAGCKEALAKKVDDDLPTAPESP